MIRCSCQGAHGCVPVAPSAIPIGSTSACSCARRSASAAGMSANVSQRPVLISTSEAISSPTRFGSSTVPCAAACTSSNRLTSPSVAGSSNANSSSTATVKSVPDSKRLAGLGEELFVRRPAARRPLRKASRGGRTDRASGARLRPSSSASPSRSWPPRARRRGPPGGSASSSLSLVARSAASPVAKLARWLRWAGYSCSRPSAISARPEWRATSGGEPRGCGLGGDHAERLREDRRDDGGVGERRAGGRGAGARAAR